MASEVILTEAPSMLVAIIFYPARSSIIFLLFLAFFGLCFWPLFLAYNTLVALCLAFGLYYFSSLVCMGMMLRTQGFVVYWALHNSVMSLVGIVLLLTMAVITKFCPKNRDVLFSFLPNEIWFETELTIKFYLQMKKAWLLPERSSLYYICSFFKIYKIVSNTIVFLPIEGDWNFWEGFLLMLLTIL